MLQEEVEKNKQGMDIESTNSKKENEYRNVEDDIEMSETLFCRL